MCLPLAVRASPAQSVVSQTLANMEGQLGIRLFDRSGRIPVLTEAGRALLPAARAVAGNIDAFKARARRLAGGLEAELSVVVDVTLPTPALTHAVAQFSARFPDVPLRLYVEALGAVLQLVLDGTCAFGIVGTLPDVPDSVVRERLMEVQIVPVASPSHPLSARPVPLTIDELSGHIQLVLTDRSSLSSGTEIGVVSTKPWRLAAPSCPGGYRLRCIGYPRRRRNAEKGCVGAVVRSVQSGRAAWPGRPMVDRTNQGEG